MIDCIYAADLFLTPWWMVMQVFVCGQINKHFRLPWDWVIGQSTQDLWNPELSLANKSFFQSIKRRSQKTEISRLGTLQIKSKSIPVFQTFTVLTRDLLCYCNNWGRMVQNVQILEKLGVHRSDLGDNKDALKINIGGFSSTLAPAWNFYTRG